MAALTFKLDLPDFKVHPQKQRAALLSSSGKSRGETWWWGDIWSLSFIIGEKSRRNHGRSQIPALWWAVLMARDLLDNNNEVMALPWATALEGFLELRQSPLGDYIWWHHCLKKAQVTNLGD